MMLIFISMIENDEERHFAEIIFDEYEEIMYRAAYKVLKHEQEAEDVVSEVWIKIISDIKYFIKKDCHELAPLFVTIVKNAAIDKYRKKKNILLVPISEDESEDYSDTVGDFVVNKDLYERLLAALDYLDDKYMSVLKLKLLHEYSNAKIAELLNITEETVRKRYSRGKKIIIEYLDGGK